MYLFNCIDGSTTSIDMSKEVKTIYFVFYFSCPSLLTNYV